MTEWEKKKVFFQIQTENTNFVSLKWEEKSTCDFFKQFKSHPLNLIEEKFPIFNVLFVLLLSFFFALKIPWIIIIVQLNFLLPFLNIHSLFHEQSDSLPCSFQVKVIFFFFFQFFSFFARYFSFVRIDWLMVMLVADLIFTWCDF